MCKCDMTDSFLPCLSEEPEIRDGHTWKQEAEQQKEEGLGVTESPFERRSCHITVQTQQTGHLPRPLSPLPVSHSFSLSLSYVTVLRALF